MESEESERLPPAVLVCGPRFPRSPSGRTLLVVCCYGVKDEDGSSGTLGEAEGLDRREFV